MTYGKRLIGLAGTLADDRALEALILGYGFASWRFDFGDGAPDFERWDAIYDIFKDTDHIVTIVETPEEAKHVRDLGGTVHHRGIIRNLAVLPGDFVWTHTDMEEAVAAYFAEFGLPENPTWEYADAEPPTMADLFADMDDYLQGLVGEVFNLQPEREIDRTVEALFTTLKAIKSRIGAPASS